MQLLLRLHHVMTEDDSGFLALRITRTTLSRLQGWRSLVVDVAKRMSPELKSMAFREPEESTEIFPGGTEVCRRVFQPNGGSLDPIVGPFVVIPKNCSLHGGLSVGNVTAVCKELGIYWRVGRYYVTKVVTWELLFRLIEEAADTIKKESLNGQGKKETAQENQETRSTDEPAV